VADPTPSPAAESGSISVARDYGFPRLCFDNSVAVALGADIEIALLINSPKVISVVEGDGADAAINLAPSVTECARLRMSNRVAANLAFNLLLTLRQAGKLDVKTIQSNIDMMERRLKEEDE
jgi:hypothetical protein